MPADPDPPFADPAVAASFAAFPDAEREGLMRLRALVFEVAGQTNGVGPLLETLKWGQPAYLTPQSKSGTTIRLGVPKTGGYALFVHCQTRLLPEFRAVCGQDFAFDGNRAVLFEAGQPLPIAALSALIGNALTYHRRSPA